MSLASILNVNEDLTFAEINCSILNADVVNATTINGGGGGGGITSITSTDSSLTVTPENNGATMNLTNAGRNWSAFPAYAEVNMANEGFGDIAYMQFKANGSTNTNLNLFQGQDNSGNPMSGLLLCEGAGPNQGTIGNIYDSYYNKPTLSDVLAGGTSGAGLDITDVGNINCAYCTCTSYLTVGDAISTSSQIHLCYDTGDSSGNNYQIVANDGNNNLTILWYNKGANPNTPLTINSNGTVTLSANGMLQVTDGTNTGRAYDTYFNPPPSVSGSVSTLAFYSNSSQQIGISSNTAVQWANSDAANTFGSTSITTSLSNARFTNSASSSKVINVSGYINWAVLVVNDASMRVLYGAKNSNNTTDRYGFSEMTAATDDTDGINQTFNFTMVLPTSQFFSLYAWQNSASALNINSGNTYPSSRIIITQFN